MPEVIVENLHSKTIHCEAKSERLLDILLPDEWVTQRKGLGKFEEGKGVELSFTNLDACL